MDIKDFKPQIIPKSTQVNLIQNKLDSADNIYQWWYFCLIEEKIQLKEKITSSKILATI